MELDCELEPQDLQLGAGLGVEGAYMYPNGRSPERDGVRELALDPGRECGGGTGRRKEDAGLLITLGARE